MQQGTSLHIHKQVITKAKQLKNYLEAQYKPEIALGSTIYIYLAPINVFDKDI